MRDNIETLAQDLYEKLPATLRQYVDAVRKQGPSARSEVLDDELRDMLSHLRARMVLDGTEAPEPSHPATGANLGAWLPQGSVEPARTDEYLQEEALPASFKDYAGGQHKHKGKAVEGVSRLLGSSYRGGIVGDQATVVVVLTPEALDKVIKPGWTTLVSRIFTGKLKCDVVYWPWTDMSTPKDSDVLYKVLKLHRLHHDDRRTIEVACHGGHGRTGTLLAILAALEMGWPAEEAVRRLRHAYCKQAVESKGQEDFVVKTIKAARDLIKRRGKR